MSGIYIQNQNSFDNKYYASLTDGDKEFMIQHFPIPRYINDRISSQSQESVNANIKSKDSLPTFATNNQLKSDSIKDSLENKMVFQGMGSLPKNCDSTDGSINWNLINELDIKVAQSLHQKKLKEQLPIIKEIFKENSQSPSNYIQNQLFDQNPENVLRTFNRSDGLTWKESQTLGQNPENVLRTFNRSNGLTWKEIQTLSQNSENDSKKKEQEQTSVEKRFLRSNQQKF